MHPEHARRHERGFTLMEVVIALLVLALALAAATQLATDGADNVRHLTRVTYAHWVAMNQFNHLRLQPSAPGKGITRGKSLMAGSTWYWERAVSAAPLNGLEQVEIRVSDKPGGSPLTHLRGILGTTLLASQNPSLTDQQPPSGIRRAVPSYGNR